MSERGLLRYLPQGGCVAGEAADHGRRRRHVPAGDHQAPGHSSWELISSLAFHKTLEPQHHAPSSPTIDLRLCKSKQATGQPAGQELPPIRSSYKRTSGPMKQLCGESSDHETIEDDGGGASSWLEEVEEKGGREGERDGGGGGDGEGGLEEEDEWGGEGEGWRMRVLNAGVIVESSERVQWHSMSPWSYCMTHSTHSGTPSLSLAPHSLREKIWRWRESRREWCGWVHRRPYTYGSGIRSERPYQAIRGFRL